MSIEQASPALLRLLQLTSPALPTGAYAYSQGLEYAVHAGWLRHEDAVSGWLGGILAQGLARLDVPLLARLYRSWEADDGAAALRWSRHALAAREAAELQAEDRHLGQALARLLDDLGLVQAGPWRYERDASLVALFALAAVQWRIPLSQAATGYVWSWLENQVAAAVRLVPLGQTAGQRILSALIRNSVAAVEQGLALTDEDVGTALPGLGLAATLHESQYSRLFRS
ncbi:MAG TPA: urease accessory protein UreF [Gammaproteobacteria bacterium]|nr:urease accessory protein UreF [Gammaproteobacteria bacterium]